jgi:hypothetical protein
MKCSICHKEIKGYSNNSHPVNLGFCCGTCNDNVVPLRLFYAGSENSHGLLMKTDGSLELVKPEKRAFTLKELQKMVDGYIEIYPTRNPKYIFLVNEEGILNDLPINRAAQTICNIQVVGNLFICPKKLFE